MEVYLIRHTTPEIEKGICYGQSDIPLSDLFTAESEKLLRHLPDDFDGVYSSPLTRCYKLAKLIKTKAPLIRDGRLLELNFGDWEMKKWDDIEKQALNHWMQDFVTVQVPNGESFMELNDRVNRFIDALLKKDDKKVAIVTHAGVIRSFILRTLDIPLKNAFKLPIDYASITKVELGMDNCFNTLKLLNKRCD